VQNAAVVLAHPNEITQAPGHPEIARIVAPNPGPMTHEGTNTYLYGSGPCAVIDPGPDDAGHLEAVRGAARERGGIGVILLTHLHGDHAEGAERLAGIAVGDSAVGEANAGGNPTVGRGTDSDLNGPPPVVLPSDGEEHGGLRAVATPGHALEHVCLLTPDRVCFSGDLVLGEGSTFVPTDDGSLAAYMDSLRRLQAEPLELICPGHGPWVTDPAAKLAEYVEHREMRERRLVAALQRGERSRAALLAEVWDDVPDEIRPVAAVVMEAHLQKLNAEGRLPPDLED
jgi:glyoxylase-like metal-dependent hydrolase (beta-lactamase superfamily II)